MDNQSQSKTSRVIDLATRVNMTPLQIREVVGGDVATIRAILSRARAHGHEIPISRPGKTSSGDITISTDQSSLSALKAASSTRNISPDRLVELLVNTAIADDMINAILDDQS